MQQFALRTYVTGANRLREIRTQDRERGLTTTEVAVLTFILVSIAAAIGVLIYNYAKSSVENLDGIDPNPIIPAENPAN